MDQPSDRMEVLRSPWGMAWGSLERKICTCGAEADPGQTGQQQEVKEGPRKGAKTKLCTAGCCLWFLTKQGRLRRAILGLRDRSPHVGRGRGHGN